MVIVCACCNTTGLAVDPTNEELQAGLRSARLAVVDDLLENREEDDALATLPGRHVSTFTERASENSGVWFSAFEGKSEQPSQSAMSTTTTLSNNQTRDRALVFEEKVGRILEHLDVSKLARLATLYVLTELLDLKRVVAGLLLLLLGVFGQALAHRHKFMVASIIFLCLYRSKVRLIVWRQVNSWAHASTDKLGAFTWAPRVVCFVPIAMKVFGQLKFIVFLQRDLMLALIVFLVTAALVFCSLQDGASDQVKLWGEGKRLKFAAYAVTIAYWGLWCGKFTDILRLLPPALIDAGGIILGSVTSDEIQQVCRKAWTKLYAEVVDDIQQDVELDAWFVLGLGNWVVDYWQQPSDFSLEMLSKMLSECFSAFESKAVHVFRPELLHLKSQMAHLGDSSEMHVLVEYLKKSLEEIPPPRNVGLLGACVHGLCVKVLAVLCVASCIANHYEALSLAVSL